MKRYYVEPARKPVPYLFLFRSVVMCGVMYMQEKFNKMIKEEDKKKPLTDEGLAQKLFLNRSEVTRLRQILCIPDSRERRRKQLNEEIKKMLQKSPQISERNLTVELNKQGFCISRYSVSEE